MADLTTRRTVTFAVRVWAEYLEQTPPIWRGEVEHLPSGAKRRFGDLDKMLECMQVLLTTEKAPDDRWR